MKPNHEQRENYNTLAIHSTDNSFGFGYRKKNNLGADEFFIKKFNDDLCNNLINDLNKFISERVLSKEDSRSFRPLNGSNKHLLSNKKAIELIEKSLALKSPSIVDET